MAIEDNLDQLYALYIANNIMTARLWQYLAGVNAQMEGKTESAFLERQLKMSIESVDLWKLAGHRNPTRLRQMAKDALKSAFESGVKGAAADDRIQ